MRKKLFSDQARRKKRRIIIKGEKSNCFVFISFLKKYLLLLLCASKNYPRIFRANCIIISW
jgi:hypothetical protein